MGRDARANPLARPGSTRAGGPINSRPAPRMVAGVDWKKHAELVRQGKTPHVRFSDRVYIIDTNGTFRRASAMADRPPKESR